MSGSTAKATQDLATLKSAVVSTSELIKQLLSSSSAADSPTKDKEKEKDNDTTNIDALKLSHDSASLIRAHSTKLSLLIINKPFTPSAITTILRELVSGPLPGLASAVQLCNGAKYTTAMSKEVQWRAKTLFTELGTLVKKIPLDGQILSANQKNGTGDGVGKGSLAVTGVVWEACDAMTELQTLGVAGLMVKRAEEYRDLIKDALEELQEWGEEQSDGEDEEAFDQEIDDGIDTSAQETLDDMLASQHHIPTDDPAKIRPRLESTNKRLRLMLLMFQAVVKRRLRTLPTIPHPALPAELKVKSNGDPGIVSCLDELLEVFRKLSGITDDLASAFYDLDSTEIDKKMDECFSAGFAAVELLIMNWEGEKDEFTVWV